MGKAVSARPYSFYFLFFFFSYLFLTVYINKIHVTHQVLTQNPAYGTMFTLLTVLVAGFVALNLNLAIMKFRELKKVNGASGLTALGIFLGILGGACPGCIVGLFPVVMGFFGGFGYSLSVFPYDGLELQVLSLILLVVGAGLMSKPAVCKI